MNFKCLVGLHKEDACKCMVCGKEIESHHDWSKDNAVRELGQSAYIQYVDVQYNEPQYTVYI